METKGLKIKLSVLYYIVFGSLACYAPFLSPYFQERGLTYPQMGIVFAVNSLVAVVSQPLWGIITDKYLHKKATMLLTLTISAFLVILFVFARGFYFILFVIIVFVMFQSPIISVNDAHSYDIIESNNRIQYGKIRLMGSVGYAITALAVGAIIKAANINMAFYSYILLAAIGVVVLRTLKSGSRESGPSINFHDILKIIKNNKYVLICLSGAFANAAMSANGNYIALLIEKTGGDISNLGMLWFIIAMSELPVFYYGNRILKRFGLLRLYLVAMLLYSGRYFLVSLLARYQYVLAAQLLQGITFPFYIMTTLQYVNEIVPSETRTTAITVFTAFSTGVGGFLGNMGGGFILERMDIFYLFKILSLLCIISLVIGLVLKGIDRKERVNSSG